MATDPNLIPGENTLSSGTGSWTIVTPPNVSIAIDDPPTRAPIPESGVVPAADETLFPTVKLVVDLNASGAATIGFVGDLSTIGPNPPDSVGFSANAEIDVVNDTGQTLSGVVLNLANADQQLPLSLMPGVVEYGHTVNANYAYFANIQPVAGETMSLASPDGKPTTATGPATSKITLTGPIAPGATVSSLSLIHNTELTSGDNNFALTVSPT